jgi:nucleoside-diphosphate-sugar epimerase
MRRRRFLQASGAIALAGLAPGHATGPVQPARRPLRILILGGTRFLGLHMTQYALDRGHRLTFFNRGRTNTDRFPQVERIKGDRNGELGGLAGRDWDAVIDNSGYVPRHVRLAAQMLRASVPHYLFVSTLSVYAGFASPNDEDSPLGTLAEPATETVDGTTYGPLKALCETAARDAYGAGNTTILRPGLLVGPDDNTDRFTYWPARAARGGRFIAPGKAADPIQLIDARDLAAFAIETLERRVTGTLQCGLGTLTVHDRRARRRVGGGRPVDRGDRRCAATGLVARRFPGRPKSPALVRHAGLGALRRRDRGFRGHAHAARCRRGTSDPSARRHGARHLALAPAAPHGGTDDAEGRPRGRTRGGGARRIPRRPEALTVPRGARVTRPSA